MLPTIKKLHELELEGVTLNISRIPLECFTLEDLDADNLEHFFSNEVHNKIADLLEFEIWEREECWKALGIMDS